MSSISAIALSGMRASLTRVGVAGHNIANTQTAGFVRQQVVQAGQPGGGTTAQVVQAAAPGEDLPGDLVELKMAGAQFAANLSVVRAEQQMLGTLLDVTA